MKKLLTILLMISLLVTCLAACGGDEPNNGGNQPSTDNAQKYDSAIAYLNEGKYEEAYQLFAELGDYSDAKDRLAKFIIVPVNATQTETRDGETNTSTMSFSYNNKNLPILITGNEGEQIELTYDANGRMIRMVQRDGEDFYSYDITYDANGNILQLIEKSSYSEADTYFNYTYNANGKPTKVEVGDGTEVSYFYEYTYDANGNTTKEVYNYG